MPISFDIITHRSYGLPHQTESRIQLESGDSGEWRRTRLEISERPTQSDARACECGRVCWNFCVHTWNSHIFSSPESQLPSWKCAMGTGETQNKAKSEVISFTIHVQMACMCLIFFLCVRVGRRDICLQHVNFSVSSFSNKCNAMLPSPRSVVRRCEYLWKHDRWSIHSLRFRKLRRVLLLSHAWIIRVMIHRRFTVIDEPWRSSNNLLQSKFGKPRFFKEQQSKLICSITLSLVNPAWSLCSEKCVFWRENYAGSWTNTSLCFHNTFVCSSEFPTHTT